MQSIKVRKKISAKTLIYIIFFITVVPYAGYLGIYHYEYLISRNEVRSLIASGYYDQANTAMENLYKHFGDSKATFFVHLDLLQALDKREHDRRNWQKIIQICRFLEHRAIFTPEKIRVLLIKAYYLMGEIYFPHALRELKILGIKKYIKITDLPSQLMVYEMFLNMKNWEKTLILLTHLADQEPENVYFKIEKAKVYSEMGEKSLSKVLLREIVFNHSYSPQINEAAKFLLQITEDLQLYTETDFLYTYILEKSHFNQKIIENYIQYLVRHHQSLRARSFLSQTKDVVQDKDQLEELRKLTF